MREQPWMRHGSHQKTTLVLAHKDDTAIIEPSAFVVRSALVNKLCCTDVSCEWVSCLHDLEIILDHYNAICLPFKNMSTILFESSAHPLSVLESDISKSALKRPNVDSEHFFTLSIWIFLFSFSFTKREVCCGEVDAAPSMK